VSTHCILTHAASANNCCVLRTTGAVLHSMIRSGLKDDSLDLAQIWKQMFTLANPAQAAQAVSSAGGEHCGMFIKCALTGLRCTPFAPMRCAYVLLHRGVADLLCCYSLVTFVFHPCAHAR
jgi:hypothetical protein